MTTASPSGAPGASITARRRDVSMIAASLLAGFQVRIVTLTQHHQAIMTPDAFRKFALSLPGTFEASHMGHPDFRVGKRIFATLYYPDRSWAMVKVARPCSSALSIRTPKFLSR